MTSRNQENEVLTIAPGVLQDVRTIAHEMLSQGETLRPYPVDGRPMFSIATTRDLLGTVICEIEVEGTPIFIGRLDAKNDA